MDKEEIQLEQLGKLARKKNDFKYPLGLKPRGLLI